LKGEEGNIKYYIVKIVYYNYKKLLNFFLEKKLKIDKKNGKNLCSFIN